MTVIDFTVTQKGLEEQLLARVIQRERKELEQKREELLLEINQNKKKKQEVCGMFPMVVVLGMFFFLSTGTEDPWRGVVVVSRNGWNVEG